MAGKNIPLVSILSMNKQDHATAHSHITKLTSKIETNGSLYEKKEHLPKQ